MQTSLELEGWELSEECVLAVANSELDVVTKSLIWELRRGTRQKDAALPTAICRG